MYGVMLKSLDQYAAGHFRAEEQCMFRYQCPVAQANSEAHSEFTRWLAEVRDRYAQKGFERADRRSRAGSFPRFSSRR